MLRLSLEQDQQTKKKNINLNRRQFVTTDNVPGSDINPPLKKQLNQLFSQQCTQGFNIPIQQKTLNYLSIPSSEDYNISLHDMTTKLSQKLIQSDDSISKCCMRLFTFMQSTQNQKMQEENKENMLPRNYETIEFQQLKHSQNKAIQKNFSKTERSVKSFKPVKNKLKPEDKQLKVKQASTQNKEKQLISFIQGSRKKREELLLQLEKVDLENLSDLYSDKLNYFTPQQGSTKPQPLKEFYLKHKVKKKLFSQKPLANEQKPTRQTKQEIKPKQPSQRIPKQQNGSICVNKSNTERLSIVRNTIDLQQKSNHQKDTLRISRKSKKSIPTDKQKVPQLKDESLCRKNSNRISLKKDRKSIIKNNEFKEKDSKKILTQSKVSQDEDRRNMQLLLKKKQELQRQLLNINGEIVLFNRKKKKPTKITK